jgi:hypothetical protein
VVVDVDGDGDVEIVVPDARGVYVVGDADHSWVSGRTLWNQASYHITNINDDLSIPVSPDPNWPSYNSFRSGDITPGDGATLADAHPVALDICLEDCDDGVVQLVAQVGNSGLAELPAGHPIELVWRTPSGDRTVLAKGETTFDVVSGRTSAGVVFRLDRVDLDGDGDLLWVVPPREGVEECIPDNNEWVISEPFRCPDE